MKFGFWGLWEWVSWLGLDCCEFSLDEEVLKSELLVCSDSIERFGDWDILFSGLS